MFLSLHIFNKRVPEEGGGTFLEIFETELKLKSKLIKNFCPLVFFLFFFRVVVIKTQKSKK